MSECIVRMEMPSDCERCPMCGTASGGNGMYELWCMCGDIPASSQRRPKDCPIICQLPDGHGELIERQPIIHFVEDGLNRGEYGHDQIEVMTEVFVAETIIPAEAERSET